MVDIAGENFILVGSLLLGIAVLSSNVASRFGAPALLLFLAVGMLFGSTFISFNSVEATQDVGMIALSIILFTGGMETKILDIRKIITPGVVLATSGVVLTALVTAGFIHLIAPLLGLSISFAVAMLVASTVASTDSASVFSILRSKRLGLREHLRPLLELESGSNDPMAYMLTILMIGLVTTTGSVRVGGIVLDVMVQFVVGVVAGYLIARAAVWAINRLTLANRSLYSIMLLSVAFFTFAAASVCHGNGYLAVYIAGLVVGNSQLRMKKQMSTFFDGFTWLLQIVMFLLLGLLVNVNELIDWRVVVLSGVVGLFIIFIARPVAVFASMAPFRRFSFRARVFVSWVGLRGATPLIFATYPLLAGVDDARLFFNVVFLVTLLSLLIQGTTVGVVAKWLGLDFVERESPFRVDSHENMSSVFTEVEVNDTMLKSGTTLKDISLPENTLVMLLYRNGRYIVPTGQTTLEVGDKLLVISDRREELERAYKALGINDVMRLE